MIEPGFVNAYQTPLFVGMLDTSVVGRHRVRCGSALERPGSFFVVSVLEDHDHGRFLMLVVLPNTIGWINVNPKFLWDVPPPETA